MQFTKEQLITHITRHSDEISRLIKQQSHHDNEYRRKLLAVNEIALASLEAKPIGAFHIADQQVGGTTDYIKDGEWPIDNGVIEVYAAPPAPQLPQPAPVVSEEINDIIKRFQYQADHLSDWHHIDEHSCKVNRRDLMTALDFMSSCRAAMLQGADGNSPVIPDGWVACSERMPDIGTEIFYFCQDDGLRDCGIVSSSNFSGKGDAELYVHAEGYDLRFGVDITHWMPLPAAPNSGD